MDAACNKKSGFAIALAWPQTRCKQAGAWYDTPLRWMRLNRQYSYKVGHAAVVLVESATGDCHYFDFGRYHAPFGHGRVRDAETDHDLEIKTKACITGPDITNYYEILLELFANSSCHGTGALHASYAMISFETAYAYAKQTQKLSPLPYGPFIAAGTNCSRFVNSVLLAGRPGRLKEFLLRFPVTFSPTPAGNVRCFRNQLSLQSLTEECCNADSYICSPEMRMQ